MKKLFSILLSSFVLSSASADFCDKIAGDWHFVLTAKTSFSTCIYYGSAKVNLGNEGHFSSILDFPGTHLCPPGHDILLEGTCKEDYLVVGNAYTKLTGKIISEGSAHLEGGINLPGVKHISVDLNR